MGSDRLGVWLHFSRESFLDKSGLRRDVIFMEYFMFSFPSSMSYLYQVYFKIASLRISERKERTFNENVSTGTMRMQMQNVIPKIRLNKFSRKLKQLDMVVQ